MKETCVGMCGERVQEPAGLKRIGQAAQSTALAICGWSGVIPDGGAGSLVHFIPQRPRIRGLSLRIAALLL
jgi:hypothetical protein